MSVFCLQPRPVATTPTRPQRSRGGRWRSSTLAPRATRTALRSKRTWLNGSWIRCHVRFRTIVLPHRRTTLPLALLLHYGFDHNGYCACCSFSKQLNYTQCTHMSAVPGPESELRSFGTNRADGAREGERGAANDAIRELLKVIRSIGLHGWIHCTCKS